VRGERGQTGAEALGVLLLVALVANGIVLRRLRAAPRS
jgi:hypothetical protein